jgi:hypothetical protein
MPVPYIPQEILDKIIGYATADDPHFSNCASFVSHNFHQITLPYKFRSVIFRRYRDGRYPDGGKVSFPFCEAIHAGDAHALSLAPLVRELSLLGILLIPDPFKIIINGVISFRNLTKLRMESCDTSSAIMEQLGELVQLQSLHTWHCQHEESALSHGALSNLQSLHTLECVNNRGGFACYLALIPMRNLRILKSGDIEVTEVLLTSDPPAQMQELYICHYYYKHFQNPDLNFTHGPSLLWNFIARVTSLTHLSLPGLQLTDGPPSSLIFAFQELKYLYIHIAFTPHFANQPLKKLKIDTEGDILMVEVRRHWQGIVFPHVECLETGQQYDELDKIPTEFWREFLLNVNEVT